MQKTKYLKIGAIFFLCVYYACGQKPFFISDKKLINYYINRNIAENEICSENLISANKSYKLTFNFFRPFSVDLVNSLITAFRLNDKGQIGFCAIELKKRGFDFSTLGNEGKLVEYLNGFFLHNKVKPTYKKSLRKTIDSLFEVDQSLRRLPDGKIKYKDSIETIDISNGNFLKNYFIKHGYPTESELGTLNLRDDNLEIIMIHQSCLNPKRIDLIPFIKNAIEKGKLNNKNGAYLLNILQCENKIDYGLSAKLYKIIFYKCKNELAPTKEEKDSIDLLTQKTSFCYPKIKETKLTEMDTNAQYLYLETFQTRLNKAKYQYKNRETSNYSFFVGFDQLIDRIIVSDQDTYRMMLKNSIYIE